MNKLSLLLAISTTLNLAWSFQPKSFDLPSQIGGKAVFVDFTEATYNLVYDVSHEKAKYSAKIIFIQKERGKPVFDSVKKPLNIKINGNFVTDFEVTTPSMETKVRIFNTILNPGKYEVSIDGEISNLIKFQSGGVTAAHWTSDLDDRSFQEAFLPSNLEYDQYAMQFNVEVVGSEKEHTIYTNGNLSKKSKSNTFSIQFPKYFNSSAGFYHIAPAGNFKEYRFDYKSIDGRNIPVLIYGNEYLPASFTNPTRTLNQELPQFPELTKKTLDELEQDYGPFPHNKIVIYNNGRGGMEYCGATMTELWALEHELTHSYFARGLMPANGNAGWIDEAIASWRDNNYPRIFSMDGSSKMSSHPHYTRSTDMLAYSYGAKFMSYLDGKIASNLDADGLKIFLRHARESYLFTPYTVEEFVLWMENYFNYKFMLDFRNFTYGEAAIDPFKNPAPSRSWGGDGKNQYELLIDVIDYHPIHRKLSLAELEDFL